MGLGLLLDNLEGKVLDIALDVLVAPLTTDQTLGVEHGVLGVGGQLILGSISNKPEKFIINLNCTSRRYKKRIFNRMFFNRIIYLFLRIQDRIATLLLTYYTK